MNIIHQSSAPQEAVDAALSRSHALNGFSQGEGAGTPDFQLMETKSRRLNGHELVEKLWDNLRGVPTTVLALAPLFNPLQLQLLPRVSRFQRFLHYNLSPKSIGQAWHAAISLAFLTLFLSMPAHAQTPPTATAETHSAMTLSVTGKCDYSTDGVTFTKLERSHILEQGAVIRTGADARVDLFFSRTGTVVRLQEDTQIKLETMSITTQDSLPLVHTLLDLQTGRIFTVVRHNVPGSTMEIKNKDGRAIVEGSGIGRYIITADGTHVAAEHSGLPLKVVHENGITVLSAGQQFSKKDGKMIPLDSTAWVKELIQIDELAAITEAPVVNGVQPKP
jgi:hypothetical protein